MPPLPYADVARRILIRVIADDLLRHVRPWQRASPVSTKMALWSVVIALLVYGIVLYARGDFG
jgi:hypothetical protein